MVVNYNEMRKIVQEWEKFPGCEDIERCPIVTPGFPGAFNMSYGEDPLLSRFGRYQHFDAPFVVAPIQQAIRHNDLFKGVIERPDKYLGVFDMASPHGLICLPKKVDLDELNRRQINSLFNLLSFLGIEKEKIRPKFCAGGKVSELTGGKYQFDFDIPEDKSSYETFLSLGIPKYNIKRDRTRDSLLALNLASGHVGWGYRCEIEIEQGSDLLDIATTEIFKWDPVFKQSEIVGLEDINYTIAVNAVGVERLFLAHKKLEDIRQIDHIKRVHDYVSEVPQAEFIRAAHRVYADKEKFGFKLSRNRRGLLNRMQREIELDSHKLEEILRVNAEEQFWFPELKNGISPMIEGIKRYREAK